ncbi:MAG: phosphatase PAP2 family protein [Thiomonas delicata]
MSMTVASFWVSVTDFGDTAVLLPLALVILVWMGLGARRLALFWGSLLVADIALVALTKIAYMGWGLHPPGIDFTGLSGHSALSMLIWPTIGVLLSVGRRRLWRLVMPLLGAALSLAIAISRLATDAHTPPEVALGALWGGGLALTFLYSCWHETRRSLPRPGLLLPLILLLPLALGYGRVFPSMQVLADVSCLLSGHAKPYTLTDLERQFQQTTQEHLTSVSPPAMPSMVSFCLPPAARFSIGASNAMQQSWVSNTQACPFELDAGCAGEGVRSSLVRALGTE